MENELLKLHDPQEEKDLDPKTKSFSFSDNLFGTKI